jgi:hypothetical protein
VSVVGGWGWVVVGWVLFLGGAAKAGGVGGHPCWPPHPGPPTWLASRHGLGRGGAWGAVWEGLEGCLGWCVGCEAPVAPTCCLWCLGGGVLGAPGVQMRPSKWWLAPLGAGNKMGVSVTPGQTVGAPWSPPGPLGSSQRIQWQIFWDDHPQAGRDQPYPTDQGKLLRSPGSQHSNPCSGSPVAPLSTAAACWSLAPPSRHCTPKLTRYPGRSRRDESIDMVVCTQTPPGHRVMPVTVPGRTGSSSSSSTWTQWRLRGPKRVSQSTALHAPHPNRPC